MDIEGGEYEALKGAIKIINSDANIIWLIEICIDEHQTSENKINPNLLATFEIFWSAGYKSYTADKYKFEINRDRVDRIVKNQKNTVISMVFRQPSTIWAPTILTKEIFQNVNYLFSKAFD
jgi:hypothetical protein